MSDSEPRIETETESAAPPLDLVTRSILGSVCLVVSLSVAATLLATLITVKRWGVTADATAIVRYSILFVLGLTLLVHLLSLARWRNVDSRRALAEHAKLLGNTAIVAILAGWLSYVFLIEPFEPSTLVLYATFSSLLFSGFVLLLPRIATFLEGRRSFRLLGWVAFNGLFSVFAVEAGLRVTQYFSTRVVFLDEHDHSSKYLDTFRLRPGTVRIGTAANSRGYMDVDLGEDDREFLVPVIGGSHCYPTSVPLRLHFTSAAELMVPRVQVYGMGIDGALLTHMPEFVRSEVLPLKPDAILVSFFIDCLVADYQHVQPEHPTLHSWFTKDELRIKKVLRKALRVLFPSEEQLRNASPPQNTNLIPFEKIVRDNPYLVDALLEKPSMPRDTFMRVELNRAMSYCNLESGIFEQLPGLIQDLKDACGDVPVIALVIPDEFQLEDTLWQELETRFPAYLKYRRHLATDRIKAELEAADVDYIDLLPIMKRHDKLSDGNYHLYHKQNTHLNRRGNALLGWVVGQKLKLVMKDQLSTQCPSPIGARAAAGNKK